MNDGLDERPDGSRWTGEELTSRLRRDHAEARHVEWVEIAGRQVAAEKLVCAECETLWLETDIDTTDAVVWKATCPKGHTWEFVW